MPLHFAPPQLPEPTLETIAGHRGLAVARDNESESRLVQIVGDPPDVEVRLPAAPTGPADPLKIGAPDQPA